MNITFDFDGTLEDDFDGSENPSKYDVQNLCKKYVSEGHDVYIVTKRFGPDNPTIKNGEYEHETVYRLAEILGVNRENIFFTNRNWKLDKILELNSQMHFENSEIEISMMKEKGIRTIHVVDPNWIESV